MQEKLTDAQFPKISAEDKQILAQELAFLKLKNGVNFAKRVQRIAQRVGERQLEKRDWAGFESNQTELRNQLALVNETFTDVEEVLEMMGKDKSQVTKVNIEKVQNKLAKAKKDIKTSVRVTLPVLNDKQTILASKRLNFESSDFKVWNMADNYMAKSLAIIENLQNNE